MKMKDYIELIDKGTFNQVLIEIEKKNLTTRVMEHVFAHLSNSCIHLESCQLPNITIYKKYKYSKTVLIIVLSKKRLNLY